MSEAGNTADMARRLAAPLAEKMGFDLVDTEFAKEGANWYLRIYIDKKDGIKIDDCEALSRPLSDMLDGDGSISHAYVLEVSSPGLDRPLRTEADFARYEGELVDISLKLRAAADAAEFCEPEQTGGRKAGSGSAGADGGHKAGAGNGRKAGGGNASGGKANAGGNVLRGRLVKLENGNIYVSDESGNVSAIPLGSAAAVKRAVIFD
ncbi:MAG: hypothetical protein LBJ10_07505 [Clostridiales bacterium]|jgi:ribosome maturation factor RimP|nr:hypothetical protein [Clostridiales bacterium]